MFHRLLLLAFVAYASAFNIVCYYTNWSPYRNGKGEFTPEKINPDLCTHISYAFAKPKADHIVSMDVNEYEMYRKVADLKKKSSKLKILLAIGGRGIGSLPFIPIASTDDMQKAFAQNVVKYVRNISFDGVDLGWEYPTTGGSAPEDKGRFTLLLQTLRETFDNDATDNDKERLLLSAIVGSRKTTIDNAYELDILDEYVDFLNVQSFDFQDDWEREVRLSAPLYPTPVDDGIDGYLNVDWVANYYVSKGFPKNKLNIGIPGYSRSYTLKNTALHDVYSPILGLGKPGPYTEKLGILAFYEVCEVISSGGSEWRNKESGGSSIVLKEDQWISFEDVTNVQGKTCYAKRNDYAGVMFWSLDFDDFSGETCNLGEYPLLTAINEVGRSQGDCAIPRSASSNRSARHRPEKRLIFMSIVCMWPITCVLAKLSI